MKQSPDDLISKTFRRNSPAVYGVCSVDDLPHSKPETENILPGARSVVVFAVPHTRSAIASKNVQMGQYDTMHTYDEVARISNSLSRELEAAGFSAVAVPAFIPIDMTPPKRGMTGAIDWRAAGVAAGLGSYGRSGLLITAKYGSAIRIGGVVTTARLKYGTPLKTSVCDSCGKCVQSCPAGALPGNGKVDKKKCGDRIFATGFRAWREFVERLSVSSPEEVRELSGSTLSMELWQNFMTGNYYSCFACQAACAPVTKKKSRNTGKQNR